MDEHTGVNLDTNVEMALAQIDGHEQQQKSSLDRQSSRALCSFDQVMYSVCGNMSIAHGTHTPNAEGKVWTCEDIVSEQPAWLRRHTQPVMEQMWQIALQVRARWQRMGLDETTQETRWRAFMCDCLSTFLSDFATVAEVEEQSRATENEQRLLKIYSLCQFLHEMPQTAELSCSVRRMQERAQVALSSSPVTQATSSCSQAMVTTVVETNSVSNMFDNNDPGYNDMEKSKVVAIAPSGSLCDARVCADGANTSAPTQHTAAAHDNHPHTVHHDEDDVASRPSALLRQWAQQASHSHIHDCLQAEHQRLITIAEERLALLRQLARYRDFLRREHTDPRTRHKKSVPMTRRASSSTSSSSSSTSSSSHRYQSALSTARTTVAEPIAVLQPPPPLCSALDSSSASASSAGHANDASAHTQTPNDALPRALCRTNLHTKDTSHLIGNGTGAVEVLPSASRAMHATQDNEYRATVHSSPPATSPHARGEVESGLRRSQKEELRLLLAAPLYEELSGHGSRRCSSSLCLRPRRTTLGHVSGHTHSDTYARVKGVLHTNINKDNDTNNNNTHITGANNMHTHELCAQEEARAFATWLSESVAHHVKDACAMTDAAAETAVSRFGYHQDMSLARVLREVDSLTRATEKLNAGMTSDTDKGRHCIRALYRVVAEMEAAHMPYDDACCINDVSSTRHINNKSSTSTGSGGYNHVKQTHEQGNISSCASDALRLPPVPITLAEIDHRLNRPWATNEYSRHACPSQSTALVPVILDQQNDSPHHHHQQQTLCSTMNSHDQRVNESVQRLFAMPLATAVRNRTRRLRAQLQLYVFLRLAWELQYVYEELRVVRVCERVWREARTIDETADQLEDKEAIMKNTNKNEDIPEARTNVSEQANSSYTHTCDRSLASISPDDVVWLSDVCGAESTRLHQCVYYYLRRTATPAREHVERIHRRRYLTQAHGGVQNTQHQSESTTTSDLFHAYASVVNQLFDDGVFHDTRSNLCQSRAADLSSSSSTTTTTTSLASSHALCPRIAAALVELAALGHTASMFLLDQRRAAATAMMRCARAELHRRCGRLALVVRAEPLLRARDAILREEQAMRAGSRARLLSKKINMAKQLLHEEAVRRRMVKELPVIMHQLWSIVHAWDTLNAGYEPELCANGKCNDARVCDDAHNVRAMGAGCDSWAQERVWGDGSLGDWAGMHHDSMSSLPCSNSGTSVAMHHATTYTYNSDNNGSDSCHVVCRASEEDKVLRVRGVDVKAWLIAMPVALAHPTRSWPAPPTRRVHAGEEPARQEQSKRIAHVSHKPVPSLRREEGYPPTRISTKDTVLVDRHKTQQQQQQVKAKVQANRSRHVHPISCGPSVGIHTRPSPTPNASLSRSPVPSSPARLSCSDSRRHGTASTTLRGVGAAMGANTSAHTGTGNTHAHVAKSVHTETKHARTCTAVGSRTPQRTEASTRKEHCGKAATPSRSPPSITRHAGRLERAAYRHRDTPLRARSPLPSKPPAPWMAGGMTSAGCASSRTTPPSCQRRWKRRRSTPSYAAATVSHAMHRVGGYHAHGKSTSVPKSPPLLTKTSNQKQT